MTPIEIVRPLLIMLLATSGCREAAEAVDVDVDEAEKVARQTGHRVATGIDDARSKVEAVGGDLRDAAQDAAHDAERAVSDAGASEADALVRDASGAIVCASPEQCTISRAYLDRLRANPGFLAGQARVVPYRRDGRAIGLEVSALEPLPKLLGFRDRDVIRSINGLAVQSLQSAPQLYLQLRSARSFKVVFERDGEPMLCQIDVGSS